MLQEVSSSKASRSGLESPNLCFTASVVLGVRNVSMNEKRITARKGSRDLGS